MEMNHWYIGVCVEGGGGGACSTSPLNRSPCLPCLHITTICCFIQGAGVRDKIQTSYTLVLLYYGWTKSNTTVKINSANQSNRILATL